MGHIAALPLGTLRTDPAAVLVADSAAEAVLDIAAQAFVGGELRCLPTTSDQFGLPLGDRRAIVELPAAGGRIAA